MQLELKPDVETRAAAQAAAAGRPLAEFLGDLIERNLPEVFDVPQRACAGKAGGALTPLQQSFSLWLRGFVNAALTINIIISVVCMVGVLAAVLFRDQMHPRFLSGLVTLSFALATFSHLGAAAVAMLSGLRYMYARFSLKVALVAVVVLLTYGALGTKFINLVQSQEWKSWLGITAAFALTLMSGTIAVWGIRNSDPAKYSRTEPRRKMTLRDFLSWRWNPNIHEEVKQVYVASRAAEQELKTSLGVPRDTMPTDIGGDFKAWNDAVKLLITVLTGLTVVSALFSDGNSVLEQVIRITMLLLLLVPALSCAYMEAFRRQCERQWQMLGITHPRI